MTTVGPLDGNISTIKINTQTLLESSKDFGVETNTENPMKNIIFYVVIPCSSVEVH